MGIKEVKKKIKEDIKTAGFHARKSYGDNIAGRVGWREDKAPPNTADTVLYSKHKTSKNSWLNDSTELRNVQRSMRYKVYNAPHGFTLRIEFRRKQHDTVRKRDKSNAPTYKKIGKWWGNGNIARGATYSGPVNPDLPEKINKWLSHNIVVRLAHEFDKLMDKSIKSF